MFVISANAADWNSRLTGFGRYFKTQDLILNMPRQHPASTDRLTVNTQANPLLSTVHILKQHLQVQLWSGKDWSTV